MPKIALFDIETAPALGWYFDLWKENNIIETERDWRILSFAYKWLGEKGITVHACPDYGEENDGGLIKDLWKLFDQADILIAHNADRFDIRKSNARFAIHGLPPPSPSKVIDTLKIAKKYFRFDSNRLDALGQLLGCGRKIPTTGKDLWLGCARDNDSAAWKQMKRYNAQDVALLERVYLKLRPWAANHPNLNFYTRADACPTCQSQQVVNDGFAFSRTGKRQRIRCRSCGARAVTGGLIRI